MKYVLCTPGKKKKKKKELRSFPLLLSGESEAQSLFYIYN